MDGENNGKPYEQMDDLGVPLFLETPRWIMIHSLKLTVSLPLQFTGRAPQKETRKSSNIFQPSIFRCKVSVSFREGK